MATFPNYQPLISGVKRNAPKIRTTRFNDGYEQRISFGLNQNPKIHMTPNSMLCQMAWNIYQIKETTIFKNFPDHETIDNIIKKIFEHYHSSVVNLTSRTIDSTTK